MIYFDTIPLEDSTRRKMSRIIICVGIDFAVPLNYPVADYSSEERAYIPCSIGKSLLCGTNYTSLCVCSSDEGQVLGQNQTGLTTIETLA